MQKKNMYICTISFGKILVLIGYFFNQGVATKAGSNLAQTSCLGPIPTGG